MGGNPAQIEAAIDSFVARANRRFIYFRWRPFLADADDEFIVELALASRQAIIVTHNTSNFSRCESLGIRVMSPREFLNFLETLS